MTNSCFSHAIAIAEGKFLSNLTPPAKKKPASNNQVDSSPSEDILRAGEVDPNVDDEDTEEEIEGLVKEVEEALADLPQNSEPSKLAAKLLLKVRGFIAKVVACFVTVTSIL
jgi:regulator of sirC expression with transglutaminase-like and TPR domain